MRGSAPSPGGGNPLIPKAVKPNFAIAPARIAEISGSELRRAQLVPKGPALAPLFALLGERAPSLPRARRKKLALAYLLIGDANDSLDEVDAFIERARPLGLAVHLYAYNPVPTSDPNLNARASRLIGQKVVVESAIENGKGRVLVGDGVWNARGPDTPAGASVLITDADGTCLTVEPA